MDVRFADQQNLERLENEVGFNAGFGVPVVRGFRKVIQVIRSAPDERTFYAMRSLNFEKLKGKRSHQHSFRLNIQWRLIVEIEDSSPKHIVVLMGIEDYH